MLTERILTLQIDFEMDQIEDLFLKLSNIWKINRRLMMNAVRRLDDWLSCWNDRI